MKSGRSPKGNIRNFGRMGDDKLKEVWIAINEENDDYGAKIYCRSAMRLRGWSNEFIDSLITPVEIPDDIFSDPTDTDTFTIGDLLASHEQTLRFLLEEGYRRHRYKAGSGAALYRTYLKLGGKGWPDRGGSWGAIKEALDNIDTIFRDCIIYDNNSYGDDDVEVKL